MINKEFYSIKKHLKEFKRNPSSLFINPNKTIKLNPK